MPNLGEAYSRAFKRVPSVAVPGEAPGRGLAEFGEGVAKPAGGINADGC